MARASRGRSTPAAPRAGSWRARSSAPAGRASTRGEGSRLRTRSPPDGRSHRVLARQRPHPAARMHQPQHGGRARRALRRRRSVRVPEGAELGVPVRRPPPASAVHGADPSRLARRRAPAGRGRLRRLLQPHDVRRPADLRALPHRQRPAPGVPRQGGGLPGAVVGWLLRGPTRSRCTARPATRRRAFSSAVEGLEQGRCIAIFPEATLTRDPQLWPMVGKTGAARLALDHRLLGDPRGAVGAAGDPHALRQAAAPAAAQDDAACSPVRRSTSTTCAAARSTPRCSPRRRAGSCATSRVCSSSCAASRRRRARFDPREHGLPRTGNPHKPKRRAS